MSYLGNTCLSCFTFISITHFELIFVYGTRYELKLVFYKWVNLLKRPSTKTCSFSPKELPICTEWGGVLYLDSLFCLIDLLYPDMDIRLALSP
jgi:hypothetical protein